MFQIQLVPFEPLRRNTLEAADGSTQLLKLMYDLSRNVRLDTRKLPPSQAVRSRRYERERD